ncbi:hypothetical protein C0Q70_03882 [Pomacea canaliculata]|uniref:Uncharacterized protein n=1 Tax=Pomacea canaliculata TaxID=400727 RepID=A0A2T7PTZ1_POMCA|nr:hypothetical protein C0Q70_03882 [Pomacea canaliculata]
MQQLPTRAHVHGCNRRRVRACCILCECFSQTRQLCHLPRDELRRFDVEPDGASRHVTDRVDRGPHTVIVWVFTRILLPSSGGQQPSCATTVASPLAHLHLVYPDDLTWLLAVVWDANKSHKPSGFLHRNNFTSGTGKEYIYPTDDPSRPALESFLRGSGDEHKTAFVPFKPKSEEDK